MDDFGASLARPLGGDVGIGPIELPEPIRRRRVGSPHQWMGLGAFAILGSTAIMLLGGQGPTADLHSAWEVEHAALPAKDDPVARDTVFAIAVDGLPSVGRSDAKVTLVMITNYACTGCRQARPLLDSLRASYGTDLRIVYKPRADEHGMSKVVGACAAGRQGAFERYDQAMWRSGNRDPWVIARELGLDLSRFASGMKRCEAIVRASNAELDKLRVDAPAFFANGRFVDPWGTENLGTFQTLIDEELAHARRRIAAGTTPDRYYQQWVLDAGQTSR